ncbi:iron dicitrate transport regulator FecR [Chitinophaga caeni]|uniref:Iron dicitrate transport regulator FecR n=1 Tax=Chitinophaga caeni TaxID=2029983 RepID=A0A291QVV2_9BACT|nr:FecR domain-containing protein [Chitinophaga caeni]ATL48067.1 iron dicitrate transport regulator FecR [Chitinophaga caeni]
MDYTSNSEHIAALIFKSMKAELSQDEQAELDAWKRRDPANEALFIALTDRAMLQHELGQLLDVEARIQHKLGLEEDLPTKLRPVRNPVYKWIGVAASVILISALTYFYWKPDRARVVEAIHPGTDKAVLTLADGSTILLDSTGNRFIKQGNASVHQAGGLLSYEMKRNGKDNPVYNTLSTPKGGQFKVVLPDGSRAWLNAASSIRFPLAFQENERRIEISGEVFLDVAQDVQAPFKVKVGDDLEIRVLGTQFNIDAYSSSGNIQTTLLEGSVGIIRDGRQILLSPGEQAVATPAQIKVNKANLDKVIAWKNGMFNFEDVSLKEAMEEIERWYDIEVIYENGVPEMSFSGKISRDISLDELLQVFAGTDLKFRWEPGRKLIITK